MGCLNSTMAPSDSEAPEDKNAKAQSNAREGKPKKVSSFRRLQEESHGRPLAKKSSSGSMLVNEMIATHTIKDDEDVLGDFPDQYATNPAGARALSASGDKSAGGSGR
jgi:hypothetical protein